MRLPSLLPFLVTAITTLLLFAPAPALAATTTDNGVLYTDSVSYCAEARAILIDSFDIAYHRANGSVTFSFSLAAVESNLNVSANLYLNAYGMQLINQSIPLCSYFEGVICPLPQVNFTGYGTYPIPSSFTSGIPSIAYTVPNFEGYARVELIRDGTGEVAACLQATLANGKTARHSAVSWCTGIFALVALLLGLFHTGMVTSPSPAQYRWFDVLYLFQTAAATGLLHLNYPLVYTAFTQNFHWALGLFNSGNVESSIDKMRARTGGNLPGEAYSDVQYINRKLSPYNEYVSLFNLNEATSSASSFKSFLSSVALPSSSLQSRATIPSVIAQNATTDISTGLPVYVNTLGIPEANAYDTIFFFFLAFIAIAIAFHVLLYGVVFLVDRAGRGKKGMWAVRLRGMWWNFCAGNALRVCLIWFLPIWIFAFWQFHLGTSDSRLSIFFAVLGILLTLAPLAAVFTISILRSRRLSSTAPSISPLYTSFRWFHSVGVLYRAYRQKYHFFWFAPLVLAMIARSAFIAFGPASAWAQVIGNIVVEGIVLLSLLITRPHKDRKGDWLASFLSLCRLIAFGLLIAFIPTMKVRPIPRVVIGLVLVVVFGIPTILLFFGMIYNAFYGYFWRRHTHRIEDGLEVERFVAADYESDTARQPAMVHIDANNFVSATSRHGSDESGSHMPMSGGVGGSEATGLGRRTSIMEPVETVYEPSVMSGRTGSHHYPSQSSGTIYSSSHGHAGAKSPAPTTGGGGMYDSPAQSPVDQHSQYAHEAYANAARGGHASRAGSPLDEYGVGEGRPWSTGTDSRWERDGRY